MPMNNDLARLKDLKSRLWARQQREGAFKRPQASDHAREYGDILRSRKWSLEQARKIKAMRHL